MKKSISLPTQVEFEKLDEQSDLQRCRIKVCKDGLVPSHNMNFSKESIEDAIPTIFNKPLLCSFAIDDNGNKTDFKGHDIEYKKEDGKYKRVYIEQPIGVVPKSCDYEFDKEGYLCVNAYIFKKYCEEVVTIIQEDSNEKDVSMEIEILEDEENEDDGITYIKKFKFTGITFLDGYLHQASIDGCNVQLFENNKLIMEEFSKLIERVNKIEKDKEEFELEKDRQNIIDKYSYLKNNENFEKIISNDKSTNKELEEALFSLSVNDTEERIREELSKKKIIVKDYWGDTYETKKYYLRDILFEEHVAIVEDNEDYYKNYGIPYTVSGDAITLNYEEIKRYVRSGWKPFEDGTEENINPVFEEIQTKSTEKANSDKAELEKLQKELEEVKANYTDLENSNAELEKSNTELLAIKEEFEKNKLEVEKKAKELEVEKVLSNFEELKSIDGYNEIFEKRMELSLDDLTTKLKVFAYDNRELLNKKLNKKDETFSKDGFIKTNIDHKGQEELTEAQKRYGEDIKKYEMN